MQAYITVITENNIPSKFLFPAEEPKLEIMKENNTVNRAVLPA